MVSFYNEYFTFHYRNYIVFLKFLGLQPGLGRQKKGVVSNYFNTRVGGSTLPPAGGVEIHYYCVTLVIQSGLAAIQFLVQDYLSST